VRDKEGEGERAGGKDGWEEGREGGVEMPYVSVVQYDRSYTR